MVSEITDWGDVNGIYWLAFEQAREWIGPINDEEVRKAMWNRAHLAGLDAVRDALCNVPDWAINIAISWNDDTGEELATASIQSADVYEPDRVGTGPTINAAITAALAQEKAVTHG